MAISLLDLLGFGSDRAIANAGREVLRARAEERLIDDLVHALAHHDAAGCSSSARRRHASVGPGPRPWRLDYTTRDDPGALAAARHGLWELGVAVESCDVRPGPAAQVVVFGTVALPPWLDVPAVEYALRRAGATDVRAVPVRCATSGRLEPLDER